MTRLMPGWLSALVLIGGGAMFGPHASAEEKSITWFVNDWSPVFIFDRPKPESIAEIGGYAGIAMKAIAAHLPNYSHRLMPSNAGRFWEEIKSGQSLCFATALKTPEREKIVYFSAVQLIPQQHLVIRKDSLSAIAQGTKNPRVLSLAKLAQRDDIAGSLELNRSYTPVIDAIPDAPGSKLKKVGLPSLGMLPRALDAGRIDYIVEYPIVIESMNKQMPFTNELMTIPLEEAPQPLVTYVVCTRNAWGAQAITDIDKAIRLAANEAEFRGALLPWLPAPLAGRFKPLLDEFYRQRPRMLPPKVD